MSGRSIANSPPLFAPTVDLGAIGFFVAIAGGFRACAMLTAAAVCRVKEPPHCQ
jgi:hypothetical protein